MRNTKKGFTLVELLVVIAILAILASVAVVGYTSFIDKAEESNAKTELHQIVTYINAELMDDGEWEFEVVTTPAVDAEGTDNDVAEVKTTYTVTVKDGKLELSAVTNEATPVTSTPTIDTVVKACPDFAGLTGNVTVSGKTLAYEYATGKSVTATLD